MASFLSITFVSFNLASDRKEWFSGIRIFWSLSNIPLKGNIYLSKTKIKLHFIKMFSSLNFFPFSCSFIPFYQLFNVNTAFRKVWFFFFILSIYSRTSYQGVINESGNERDLAWVDSGYKWALWAINHFDQLECDLTWLCVIESLWVFMRFVAVAHR